MIFKILIGGLLLLYAVMSILPDIGTSTTPFWRQNILFVTAHPDDESMFFGPTLRYAVQPQRNNSVNLLCLSVGDAAGLGSVRVHELGLAAHILGLPSDNVTIVDTEELPDAQNVTWSPELVKTYIAKAAKEFNTTMIVTFDEYGISGHTNHQQVYQGALEYVKEHPNVGLASLKSVPLFRKYLFIVDAIFTRFYNLFTGSTTIFASQKDYHLAHSAMVRAHKSQMVWFRHLYVMFSRYMIVNDLDFFHKAAEAVHDEL